MQSIEETVKGLDYWVLQYLGENTPSGYDFWAFSLSNFVGGPITKDMAGAICRNLRNRGFVTFERGLFSEDGMPAGSGYAITKAGRDYLKTLIPESVEERPGR